MKQTSGGIRRESAKLCLQSKCELMISASSSHSIIAAAADRPNCTFGVCTPFTDRR